MGVYLDHNATTPLRFEARERWLEVVDQLGGNPSSLHADGRTARAVIDDARERVAAALGAHEEEIVFTSGGTESNNLALQGSFAVDAESRAGALVTTAAEHSSVLETARALAERGHPLEIVAVDKTGLPDLAKLENALRASTTLVSVMAANNEVGSIPALARVRALFERAPFPPPRFHTDAVQALGRIPIELDAWGIDLASFSAHKVGGPPGIGVLWRRRGTPLVAIMHGGGHEHALRPGTEDAAGIASAASAIELATREQEALARDTQELVRFMWGALASAIPGIEIVGPDLNQHRLPNTLCMRVPNTDGKVLVTRLDLEGIRVGAGSACASGSLEPSHVLLAMGYDKNSARSGLRVSVGRSTSREECKRAVDVMAKLFVASHAT